MSRSNFSGIEHLIKFSLKHSVIHLLTMATSNSVRKKKTKFRFFPREIEIYCEQMKTNNDSEQVLEKLYENLCPGDVPDELRKYYEKALFGNDEIFKKRVIERIYRIGKIAR